MSRTYNQSIHIEGSTVTSGQMSISIHDAAELHQLLADLKTSLATKRDVQPEAASAVTNAADAVAAELAREKPDGQTLRVTADGLKAAAAALKGIAPDVIDIAGQIVTYVSRLLGL